MDADCSQLIQALGGADLRQRRRAFKALEKRSRFSCLESALASQSTPDLTKRLICEILCRTRWREAVPVLLQQLESANPSLRAVAADALGDIGDDRAGPSLLKLLEDPNQPTSVRDTAASSLGAIGYHAAWPVLAKHLGDPAKTVRYCSAKSLMFLAEPNAVPALEAALREEKESDVRDQIREALETIRESHAATGANAEDEP